MRKTLPLALLIIMLPVTIAYSGFSPLQKFTLSDQQLSFSEEEQSKTITLTAADSAIYNTYYTSLNDGKWTAHNFTQSSNKGWITSGTASASVTIPKSGSMENYIITYSCSRLNPGTQSAAWDCHDGWQIRQVNTTLAQTTGPADYYVATTGSDANPGTLEQPFATWQKGFDAAGPGDIVYIRGGTYYPAVLDSNRGVRVVDKSGDENNPIKVYAYPGETPILDVSVLTRSDTNNWGIYMANSHHWHLKGLEIVGASQQEKNMFTAGLRLEHCNNNILEALKLHDNQGPGLNIYGSSEGNLVLNCDFYNNYDPYTLGYPTPESPYPGGNADGMGISFIEGRSGDERVNTISGCRAYNNSDDGYDLWKNEGIVIINNSWAFGNGYAQGDGNGFKLGLTELETDATYKRYVTNCIAADNSRTGFTQNDAKVLMKVYNNAAYNNGYYGVWWYSTDVASIYKNNIFYGNSPGNYAGNYANLVLDHNSYDAVRSPDGVAVTDDDFVSLDSSQLSRPRKADGSLPDIDFLKPAPESSLIDAGVDVGLPYEGEAPDLGAYETDYAQTIETADYYVATDGKDTNPGTLEQPFATWQKGFDAAGPGDIVYIRGGTYRTTKTSGSVVTLENKHGTASENIRIFAYPGEKPVLDLSDVTATGIMRGIMFANTDFVHIKGLAVKSIIQRAADAPHYGMFVGYGSESNIIEGMEFSSIGGYGFFMYNADGACTNNLILNCDSHHNGDPLSPSPYGRADGFTSNWGGTGSTNTFRGCRAWWNSDDGFDFLENNGVVKVESCWSFRNGYVPGTMTPAAAGSGVKLGSTTNTDVCRYVSNCLFFENRGYGLNTNDANATCITVVANTVAYKGANYGFHLRKAASVIRNSISYANTGVNYLDATVIHDHNSWDSGLTVTDDDFASLDPTGLDGPRKADGSLPDIDFLKLAQGSDLIDAGVDVGLPYSGDAPDIGAYEYSP